MVKVLSIIFLLIFFFQTLDAADVDVSAYIEKNSAIEKQPIAGVITVTHPKQAKIGFDSFKMDGKTLKTTLQREEGVKGVVISIFSFNLEPKPPGLYLLPSIAVTVDKIVYHSISTSYEVHTAPIVTEAEKKEVIFRLEASYDGPTPLYPGERGFFIYRISYNVPVDITLSQLPFLKQEDFRNIGDVTVVEKQSGGLSTQEIKQEIEALKLGSFTYGPSVLEGTSYRLNAVGEKETIEKLHAEAPPITIVVSPFPQTKLPLSFNGAVGHFSMKAQTNTPEAYLGDQITLTLDITGQGSLEEVRLPNLLCQPGFSGLFRFNDLPPAGDVEGKTKRFFIVLSPRSLLIKAIPPIEFSYFDPKKKEYVSLKTESIPLKVKNLKESLPIKEKERVSEGQSGLWRGSLQQKNPLELESMEPLYESNLQTNLLKTGWSIIIIPIGALLLWLQMSLQKVLVKKSRDIESSSQLLLDQALSLENDPDKMIRSIIDAFLKRLRYKNRLPYSLTTIEEVPPDMVNERVRAFLRRLEEIRFGHLQSFPELVEEARKLFRQI